MRSHRQEGPILKEKATKKGKTKPAEEKATKAKESLIQLQRFYLKITLTTEMLGTVPKDPDIYKSYIATKGGNGDADINIDQDIEKVEEKGWTGFRKDKEGLYLLDYMIKGFLKNAANELKEQMDRKGFKSTINNTLFVTPRRLYLCKDEEHLAEVEGVVERPLMAMTQQGPRVSLARSDKVEAGTVIECFLAVLEKGKKTITEDELNMLFSYGEYIGLGQFRNGSYGQFKYELKQL